MNKCEEWLKDFLGRNGCMVCDSVREAAKEQGFKKAELKQARKSLGVKTYHQYDDDGATPNWFWYLE